MLSGTPDDTSQIKFPVLASVKLDGIRCLRIKGETVSRTFKQIPNKHIQELTKGLPDGLDGELMVVDGFSQVQSSIMSADGTPDFEYYVFDYVSDDVNKAYDKRMAELSKLTLPAFCKVVLPVLIKSAEELDAYEAKCLAEGYEGIMTRKPDGKYKCGRSTEREGLLLKVKRFKDSEVEVIGFEEQNENTNEAEQDAFGRTKRSSAKAGMVGKDTLGKFLVKEIGDTPWKGKEFAIGTGEGLTAELRKQIWDDRDSYLGKIITYKYQPHGTLHLPRIPIFKGFRSKDDMS
jgi:DNA ligase-1